MSGTTLQAISIYKLLVPLREPFVISLGPLLAVENIIVVLRTADGHVGYGEAPSSPLAARAWTSASSWGSILPPRSWAAMR
jgi:L-alanine-DL-glutamate epimerase-like enolase superfamily enzyme